MTQDIIGTRKGDYEILALLGVGGMGQVYKVRNVLSDRIEAMKVLLPNLGDQKMLADRFIREIKVLAGLHHPNIAELRTALTIDNQLVMIMEFVEGTTLAARIAEGGLPYGRSLGYIQQVLAALSCAHAQKIIHRDIKPSNMMLTPKGIVKLMDFGIARQDGDVTITMTNSTVGSVAYMSPEQVKGEPADARSDLYSVGVSLYELITGQRPFKGDTGFSIMRAHLETMPKPPIELRPDLPAAVSDLILMSVAKDPAKRFQSADAFSRAIDAAFAPVDAMAPTVSVAPLPDPTVMAPPVLGETIAAQNPTRPFHATQIAAATLSATSAPSSASSATPPVPGPASIPQNNYRGFYIALGAMIVLVVLVAAGFYVPRHLKAQAAAQQTTSAPVTSGTSNDTTQPATDNSSGSSGNSPSQPNDSAANTPTPSPAAQPAKVSNATASADSSSTRNQLKPIDVPPRPVTPPSTSSAPPQSTASQPPTSADTSSASVSQPPANAAQQVETAVDQMSSRVGSVTSSLDNLQKQQAAQGLNLRGDMVAAEQRMQTNMNKAQAALQAGNAAQAQHYLDLAEPDVEKLERFLGN